MIKVGIRVLREGSMTASENYYNRGGLCWLKADGRVHCYSGTRPLDPDSVVIAKDRGLFATHGIVFEKFIRENYDTLVELDDNNILFDIMVDDSGVWVCDLKGRAHSVSSKEFSSIRRQLAAAESRAKKAEKKLARIRENLHNVVPDVKSGISDVGLSVVVSKRYADRQLALLNIQSTMIVATAGRTGLMNSEGESLAAIQKVRDR